MGLGPNILALYQQMKLLGAFDGITDVVELGSQGVWCPDKHLLTNLFEAFGKPVPPTHELDIYINSTGTGIAPSRHLHEQLGFRYECIDIDAKFGSLTLDLNFDLCPSEYCNRFGLTTNHGTTEHLLNQYNAFKLIHDITKPGGLMLHGLPFMGYLEHGFFNYQPNFFTALARYNSYRTLGVWVSADRLLHSLIPWEPGLLEILCLNAKTEHLLVVIQQKMYEPMIPQESASRYQLVVDGDYYSGSRITELTRPALEKMKQQTEPKLAHYSGRELLREAMLRLRRRLFG